jgi:hypothetical protein
MAVVRPEVGFTGFLEQKSMLLVEIFPLRWPALWGDLTVTLPHISRTNRVFRLLTGLQDALNVAHDNEALCAFRTVNAASQLQFWRVN